VKIPCVDLTAGDSNTNHVFSPLLIHSTLEVLGYFKVETAVRLAGLMIQGHIGFFGSAVAFFDIAANASRDNIFPGIAATPGTGYDVIQG
jgi:hypothetical protein